MNAGEDGAGGLANKWAAADQADGCPVAFLQQKRNRDDVGGKGPLQPDLVRSVCVILKRDAQSLGGGARCDERRATVAAGSHLEMGLIVALMGKKDSVFADCQGD